MELKDYINSEIKKLHKKSLIENQIKLNKGLIKENEEEVKTYQSNVYESYKKDFEDIVKKLAEVCNDLESSALKQESYLKTLPEVALRVQEAENSKKVILDIFKEVKKAKLTAERKLYEMK